MNYAQRMKQYRFENNLTQSQIARKLGVSQQVYSNIERGRIPKMNFVETYRKVIEVNLFEAGDNFGQANNNKKKSKVSFKKSHAEVERRSPQALQIKQLLNKVTKVEGQMDDLRKQLRRFASWHR